MMGNKQVVMHMMESLWNLAEAYVLNSARHASKDGW